MVFKWREDYTILVLDLLKNEESLWNTKSASYRNKKVRDKALERIAKGLNLEGVTPEDVKLKIKSIRTRYSSELGKIIVSKRCSTCPEDVYKPKLFWFSQADIFLRPVCNPRPSLTTKDQEQSTYSVSDTEESENQEEENFAKKEKESFVEQSISSNTKRELSSNENAQHIQPEMKISRKRAFLSEPVEMCSTTLGAKNEGISEFEAVGINVAKKLAKMESMQAVLAEFLISVIIRRGLLNQLTEDTNICNGECTKPKPSKSSLD